jgi:superfamily I DNA/RNA helicase
MLRRFFSWIWYVLFGQQQTSQSDTSVATRPKNSQVNRSNGQRAASLSENLSESAKREGQDALPAIYAAKAFDCAPIKEAALALFGKKVSLEQQHLVFSEAGAQVVAAGAGSGKSSTLVRRLLLMRHFLHISLSEITVFTFTVNSREDFIKKLIETAESLSFGFKKELAESRVKTFHSKLMQLISPTLPRSAQIFEFLGKAKKSKTESDADADHLLQLEELAGEVDNPFDNKISANQAQILRDVYDQAYSEDESFQSAIYALIKHAFRDSKRKDENDEEDWNRRKIAKWRDSELTAWFEDYWKKVGKWPIKGVLPPPRTLHVENLEFEAHGYLPTAGVFIILTGDDLSKDIIEKNGKKFSPAWSGKSKRNILLRGCSEGMMFVKTEADFKRVHELIKVEEDLTKKMPPMFNCRLPGEGGKLNPVNEAIYGLGVFIENLGLRPEDMFDQLKDKQRSDLDRKVLYVTSRFFHHFNEYKSQNGIFTFNDLFFKLQEDSPALKQIPIDKLKSMKHLLIDEFQDISPLIVSMIKGIHKEIIRRSDGKEQPTLLVVGDDWQSIYGWRGSAPRFFLEFSKLFSGANSKTILLGDNYRSSSRIVNCAAQVLKTISPKYKMPKNCQAKNKEVADFPAPVFLVEDMRNENVGRVMRAVADLCSQDEEILVVARTGRMKTIAEGFSKQLPNKNIDVMTVHGSKGLEADYVLVLEDMIYANENSLKNTLYAKAGFTQSFDEAQRDEAMRIAYVALTRAKKLCIWQGRPSDEGAMSLVPRNQPYCRSVDIDLLLDELKVIDGKATSVTATEA